MIKNILLAVSLLMLTILSCTKLTHKYSWDMTQNHANTLTQQSMKLIDNLDAPITITIYSPDIEILNTGETILSLFKKYSNQIQFVLQQTILDPTQAAKLKVTTDHNLVVTYKEVQQAIDIRLNELSEQHISALIQQIYNHANHWLVFISGHNEGDPLDSSDFGLSGFAQLFAKQGMRIATLNLAQQKFIPDNTAVLVVANPQQDFLPSEKVLMHQYLCNGGKLLWFTEPDAPITAFIAEEFGLKPSRGVVIDPESSNLGSPHPALKIITRYPEHVITKDITSATVMPWSSHLQILYQTNDWEQTPILTTTADTWTYHGAATKDLAVLSKNKEIFGPLNLGIALSRQKKEHGQEQRALVIADSSFMINKYLPLYANAQLATNLIAWTHNNAQLFIFDTPPLKGLSYSPSKNYRFIYQYVFTLFIPIFLLGVGFCLGINWPKLRFRFRI